MEKQGIVKIAVYTEKTWDSKYGKMYDHAIEIGEDKGIYSSKSPDQKNFVVGETVAYTVTPNGNFPSKIKPVQKKDQPTNGISTTQKQPPPATTGNADLAASALACATQVYVSKQQDITGEPFTIDDIFPLADKMLGWLKSK